VKKQRRKTGKKSTPARRKPPKKTRPKTKKPAAAPKKKRGGGSYLKPKSMKYGRRGPDGRFISKTPPKSKKTGLDPDKLAQQWAGDLELAGFDVTDWDVEARDLRNIGGPVAVHVEWHFYTVWFEAYGEPVEPERVREAFQPFYERAKRYYNGNTILRILVGLVNEEQTDERWATIAATQKFTTTVKTRGPMKGYTQGGAFEANSIEDGVLKFAGVVKNQYKEFYAATVEVVAPGYGKRKTK